jgi:amino acid transporter/nucleotide-binding universal stress UspA family protein
MKGHNSAPAGDHIKVKLSRDLGLFSITMIGVGAMIGAGIFVLTGIAAGAAGPALILSFALNGLITIFTAMVYAELGSAIPEAGGGYLWVKEGLPGPNAFQAGWMSWFAHSLAGSLYALGFGAYLGLVLSDLHVTVSFLPEDWLQKAIAVVIILIFLAINYKGVSETGTAGNVVTVAKILILLIFVGSGLWVIIKNPEFLSKFQNFAPRGWTGIISAMGLTFIAFEGYEIIVQAGEEVVNPRKNIPKAVFLSLAIVIPIYILVAFVAIGAVRPDAGLPTYQWLAKHAELGIAEAARQFMPFGTFLLLMGGLFSTMSALNATIFSSTRVSFAMGRDRHLPSAFASVNRWTKTPHRALMFSGGLIVFMAVAIPIKDVAAAADIMFLLLFLQVNLAVITLRKKYGTRLRYGYLLPFFPLVPIIGIITQLSLALFMFNYSPLAWYFALGWIGLGMVIYYSYAKRRRGEEEPSPLVLQEKLAGEELTERFKVLVPVANPESLKPLLLPAIAAAKENDGLIILLNVIVIPEQAPLAVDKTAVDARRGLMSQAHKLAEEAGVPVESLIKISHRPANAIINTAVEKKASLLVMGWRGKSKFRTARVGSNIDQIIRQVNCRAMIVQQNEAPPFRRVLVPCLNFDQLIPALDQARYFAGGSAQDIKVIRVFRAQADSGYRQYILDQLQAKADEFRKQTPGFSGRITVEAVEAKNAVEGIARASRGVDAVFLGASRENVFKKILFGNKPKLIAQKVEPPVILLRPKAGAVKFGLAQIVEYLRGGYKKINVESEKKLKEEGMLVPSGKKRTAALHTGVNTVALSLSGLAFLSSVCLMFFGKGRTLTWVGVLLFFGSFVWFTTLSIKGIKKNSRQE